MSRVFASVRAVMPFRIGNVYHRARVVSGANSAELSTGDSAHYAADLRHAIENAGPGDLVAFLVDVNRSG